MAKTYNSTIEKGRSWSLDVQWIDSAGDPINLTGHTIRSSFVVDYGSSPLITLQVGSGITITNAVNGQFTMTVPRSTTSSWAVGNVLYDVLVIYPDDRADTILDGTLKVVESITL